MAATWERQFRSASGLPTDLRDRAAGLCHELGPGAGGYLVVADLHYRNVPATRREPWLVIDPMPLAGDKEFGLASLIWGRLEAADTHRLLGPLIEIGDLDQHRARAWTLVGATAKLMRATGRVAQNCEAVARDLWNLIDQVARTAATQHPDPDTRSQTAAPIEQVQGAGHPPSQRGGPIAGPADAGRGGTNPFRHRRRTSNSEQVGGCPARRRGLRDLIDSAASTALDRGLEAGCLARRHIC